MTDDEDNPRTYLPTPEEIERECAKLRPGKLKGYESRHPSPARILENVVDTWHDPRDDKDDAA